MAEAAIGAMTLDDFLRWDDGTETHYELIGGVAVAMAPPAEAHRILACASVADRRRARQSAPVQRANRSRRHSTRPSRPLYRGRHRGHLRGKRTGAAGGLRPVPDRRDPLAEHRAYRQIETIQEILLIASDERYAEQHRRSGG
jgi:hypothetical protein